MQQAKISAKDVNAIELLSNQVSIVAKWLSVLSYN